MHTIDVMLRVQEQSIAFEMKTVNAIKGRFWLVFALQRNKKATKTTSSNARKIRCVIDKFSQTGFSNFNKFDQTSRR